MCRSPHPICPTHFVISSRPSMLHGKGGADIIGESNVSDWMKVFGELITRTHHQQLHPQ